MTAAARIFSCIFECLRQHEEHVDAEEYMTTICLPPEILERVFRELKLDDMKNCSQTCLRWKFIIDTMQTIDYRIVNYRIVSIE